MLLGLNIKIDDESTRAPVDNLGQEGKNCQIQVIRKDVSNVPCCHKSTLPTLIPDLPPHIKPNLFKIPIHLRIPKRRELRLLSRQFYRLTILFVAITG